MTNDKWNTWIFRKTKLGQISMVLRGSNTTCSVKNKLPGSKKVNLTKFMLRADFGLAALLIALWEFFSDLNTWIKYHFRLKCRERLTADGGVVSSVVNIVTAINYENYEGLT